MFYRLGRERQCCRTNSHLPSLNRSYARTNTDLGHEQTSDLIVHPSLHFRVTEKSSRWLGRALRRAHQHSGTNKKEYNDIENALEVMKKFGVEVDAIDSTKDESEPATIGDMAIEVIAKYPAGVIATDILREIQSMWKPDLMRTSLSPPLSRLKERGLLDYHEDTGRWFISNKQGSDVKTSEPVNSFEQGDDFDDEIPF